MDLIVSSSFSIPLQLGAVFIFKARKVNLKSSQVFRPQAREPEILPYKRKRSVGSVAPPPYPLPDPDDDETEDKSSEEYTEEKPMGRHSEDLQNASNHEQEIILPLKSPAARIKYTKRRTKTKKGIKRQKNEKKQTQDVPCIVNQGTQTVSETIDRGTQTFSETIESEESKRITHLPTENFLLKRQLDLLSVHNDEKAKSRERDIARLQAANLAMCQQLDLHRILYGDHGEDPLGPDAQVAVLKKALQDRENEIEQKLKLISYVEERMYSVQGLTDILDDLQSNATPSIELSNDLTSLGTMISRTASLLMQAVSKNGLRAYHRHPGKSPALRGLLGVALGRVFLLERFPRKGLSALLFSFIQERIFYAECWKLLQLEGYMVRGYQELIQNIEAPPGTLEAFHKASIELMLKENHQFNDCWIKSRVEDLHRDLLGSFDRVFDPQAFEAVEKPLFKSIDRLLTTAFHLRARCVSPAGISYELLHLKKRDFFDLNYMEAQELDGTPLSGPDNFLRRRKIMMCIQGCLLDHPVDPNSDHDSLQLQKTHFVRLARQRLDKGLRATGTLKSEKAIVILSHS